MNSDNLQEHTHKGEGSRLLSLAKMSGDRLEGRLFMEGYHCPPISTRPLQPEYMYMYNAGDESSDGTCSYNNFYTSQWTFIYGDAHVHASTSTMHTLMQEHEYNSNAHQFSV